MLLVIERPQLFKVRLRLFERMQSTRDQIGQFGVLNMRTFKRLYVIIPLLLILTQSAPTTQANVTFFLQREGSVTDNGFSLFITNLGVFIQQDFEGLQFSPNGTPVPFLGMGTLQLKLAGEFNGPFVPRIFSSTEFNVPGEIFGKAVLAGFDLTIQSQGRNRPRGLGLWIFDDARTWDAAYLVEVTEADGTIWQTILENQTPLNSHGHEIEGFVGAISDIGIVRMQITAIDPASGTPIPDLFEIDSLISADFPVIAHGEDDFDSDETESQDMSDDEAESDDHAEDMSDDSDSSHTHKERHPNRRPAHHDDDNNDHNHHHRHG